MTILNPDDEFVSLAFSRDCQSGRDWAERGPSLHENTVVPTLTCLCRVSVPPSHAVKGKPPEYELKVVVKSLERELGQSFPVPFLTHLLGKN